GPGQGQGAAGSSPLCGSPKGLPIVGPPGLGPALRLPGSTERDLPEPLDQKVVTWEAVQKENFLSELEKRRKEGQEELLRKAAHRVDVVAKYLEGLREQERRVRHLESQVGYCAALLSSMAESLARGSAYWNSRNSSTGNPPASADHGGALGSRECPEAGQPPSNP
ncbi:hypothetical protein K5549_018360, partial [Capra hircus]